MIPTIPQAHADALLAAARKLDEAPYTRQEQERLEDQVRAQHRQRQVQRNGQGSVIDTFNAAHAIDVMLQQYGYTKGNGGRYIRPGGKSESVSVKDEKSCHWSSNDPLNDGKVLSGCGVHDAFDLYTYFEHGGDVGRTVKAAAAALGMKLVVQSRVQSRPVNVPAMAPYRAFPVHVLPTVLSRFIREGAEALGCDASFVALPLLAGMASAVGNSRRIRLKTTWTEPPILWCIVVGDSGTLKSPAFDLALDAIRIRQMQAMKEFKRAQAEYLEGKEKFDADLKAWKKEEPGQHKERPTEPEPPICERFWCSDTTVEALAALLSDAPRGLLLARDELAGWLGSFNQYKQGKGSDVPHWLEVHRGGPLLVDRKSGDKTTIHVPRAAVCIAGGIQPETLRRCLTTEFFENGLAARLLLAMPPRRVKRWTEAEIDPGALQAVVNLLNELLSFQATSGLHGEPEPADVTLTDEAKEIWVAYYNRHAEEQAQLSGDLSAAWSKLEGYAARFALVIHCIRQASNDGVDPWHVDAESMRAGTNLADWFGHEAKRVYAMLAESQEDRERRELLQWIEEHGRQATVRALTHGLRRYRGKSEQAEADLQQLVDAKVGYWESPKPNRKGGRQPRVFHLIEGVTGPSSSNVVTGVTDTKTFGDDSAGEGNGDGDSGDEYPDSSCGDAGADMCAEPERNPEVGTVR